MRVWWRRSLFGVVLHEDHGTKRNSISQHVRAIKQNQDGKKLPTQQPSTEVLPLASAYPKFRLCTEGSALFDELEELKFPNKANDKRMEVRLFSSMIRHETISMTQRQRVKGFF
jgi:hypothetical protein